MPKGATAGPRISAPPHDEQPCRCVRAQYRCLRTRRVSLPNKRSRGGRVPAHSVILCVQQRNSVHAHSAAGLATESFADHAVLLAVFAACATQASVLPSRPAAVVTWCSAVSVPAVSMTSPRRRRM